MRSPITAAVSWQSKPRAGTEDRAHVVLGFDNAAAYEKAAGAAFGALLGRNANRIGGGRFELDGQTYELSKNEAGSTLHGGAVGFGKLYWQVIDLYDDRLVMELTSPAGDQGFPGELRVTAEYRLEGDTLWLEFAATTTKPTPVSLSAHPYFNLGGPECPDIMGHVIEIVADQFLVTDARQIPTGEMRPVNCTPFDFRRPTAAGARMREPHPQMLIGKGYDHYFIHGESRDNQPRLAARASDPETGRVLEILTTQPGLQFYTGNNLNGAVAGRGGAYRQSAGLAFEPQGFPDAVNHPEFPSDVLRPGETYRQTIGYRLTLSQ